MAQGSFKLGKGKGMSRAKQMKAKQAKKGARTIKPKKQKNVLAITTEKKLRKVMTKNIEKEMSRRAGTMLPFKMLPNATEEAATKGKGKSKK
eukprot:m.183106 g.183106  ORF g.183106 m.183106 type:complete len:92 (-) comp15711_c0_seq1:69-344(-)